MHVHLKDDVSLAMRAQKRPPSPAMAPPAPGPFIPLHRLPWDVTTLIFEELDTRSLVAATVSGARAHPLPEPLERISPKLCRRRYERFGGQVTYPHRRASETTRNNTWSVLLSEQEKFAATNLLLGTEQPQSINCVKFFRTLAKLLPLWETSNTLALGSFWSRFHKMGLDDQMLSARGEQALLYLGLIDAKQMRPAAHAYYCALALSQMRRCQEASEAFAYALSLAHHDDAVFEQPARFESKFCSHLSRPAILFSMWFLGHWLDLPPLAAQASQDGGLRPYDLLIGRELIGRLGRPAHVSSAARVTP